MLRCNPPSRDANTALITGSTRAGRTFQKSVNSEMMSEIKEMTTARLTVRTACGMLASALLSAVIGAGIVVFVVPDS